MTPEAGGDSRELPTLALDPATLADRDGDLAREWLVTNGLGGYALGTLCGATTRSYDGLLVAATRPPVERRVLVAKLEEVVTLADGTTVELGTNEWADGTIAPRGYQRLVGFALEGSIPRWTFRLGDGATLEKRLWMEHGQNLTYVQYRFVAAPAHTGAITLDLRPFCLDRDHHGVTRSVPGWRFQVDATPMGCTVRASESAQPYRLLAGPGARFSPNGEWYLNLFHRDEHARGLPNTEDVFVPGRFTQPLAVGATATLVLLASQDLPPALADLGGPDHESVVAAAWERERRRQSALLARVARPAHESDLRTRLVLAADQFLVARPHAPGADPAGNSDPAVTVIAGYPWFADWGRDTMIALPGLTLATGRYGEARGLLRTFAGFVDQGMLPNRFPEEGGAAEYNTADATLWYFVALGRYLEATQDWALLTELFPLLTDIVGWHERGTRYGIGVDPTDGLLRAGAPGVQLTWMDAKVDDWVVTPRRGKPVELNALWYAALSRMCDWAARLGQAAAPYEALRSAVAQSFFARFWYPAGGYLYDVVDVEGQRGALDWSLRPNQLLVLALAPALVPPEPARSILDMVERTLLTPLGLRTLAPADPKFKGSYRGDQRARDAAYHQGTAWPWLLGAYVDACRAVRGAADLPPGLLAPFRAHLYEAGIGSISEVADGAPPFHPGGCIAQAWSVAELLRILTAW